MNVRLFGCLVSVQVRTKVHALPIKLLECGRPLEREADDLVRDELLLERSARLGPVIHDTGRITPVVAIGRPMVARVRVVEHLDGDTLDAFGPLDRRHIHERLSGDLLKRSLDDLSPVLPAAADRVGEVLVGLGDGYSSRCAARR